MFFLTVTFDQWKGNTLFDGASLKSSQEVVDGCQNSHATIAPVGMSILAALSISGRSCFVSSFTVFGYTYYRSFYNM